MNLAKLTAEKINKMDYNHLIGVVKETNRPPGGRETVRQIVRECYLTENKSVLEIGTSTGFTALEIRRLIKCGITAIDINENSLNEAKKRAALEKYEDIKFVKADMNKLPFADKRFDVVIVGNVLSLVNNKELAFSECTRVCKKDGFIVVIPMYYIKKPPRKLVQEVSTAIKVNITPLYLKDWQEFFELPELEVVTSKNYKFNFIEEKAVSNFVKDILNREHLKKLPASAMEALRTVYKKFMLLFRDNLSYMGYSIILLSKKRKWEDPALFKGSKI